MNKLTTLAAVGFFLGACATPPEKIAIAQVSTFEYEEMTCKRLSREHNRKSKRIAVLYNDLKKEADNDAAQVAGGFILWPVWFFVEGGDDARASEYSQLRGELEAIQIVLEDKECEK